VSQIELFATVTGARLLELSDEDFAVDFGFSPAQIFKFHRRIAELHSTGFLLEHHQLHPADKLLSTYVPEPDAQDESDDGGETEVEQEEHEKLMDELELEIERQMASKNDEWQSSGRVLRVPQDFKSIQRAVDQSQPGDRILLAKGHYTESVSVSIYVSTDYDD
jgi:hypothetical protein